MNSKPHRQNTDFQLRHFLMGDCKTADGAWCLLYGQKIDQEHKLAVAESQRKRREAKIAAAQEILDDESQKQSARLNAEADILEAQADIPIWEMNLKASQDELATINELMEELEPHRKYGHLGVLQANEACQQEEWKLELMARAENYMLTVGTIPADELRTMRSHPDFDKGIKQHITALHNNIINLVQKQGNPMTLLTSAPSLLALTSKDAEVVPLKVK